MDRTGTELARASLRYFSQDLIPEHERTRQLLLGHLASQGATAEQLAQEDDNNGANAYLLEAFTRLLPTAHGNSDGWSFTTDDPHMVKTLQSNVVWRSEQSGGHHHIEGVATGHKEKPVKYGERPYVVLGKNGEGRKTIWVVGCVGENNHDAPYGHHNYTKSREGKVFYLFPGYRSRQRIGQLDRTAASEFPSPDEARQMFVPWRRAFVVTGRSPRSTVVKNRGSNGLQPVDRMSDFALGQFDVNSHLQRIATALGKTAQLDELLDRFARPDAEAA